jgi:hypothetical protein
MLFQASESERHCHHCAASGAHCRLKKQRRCDEAPVGENEQYLTLPTADSRFSFDSVNTLCNACGIVFRKQEVAKRRRGQNNSPIPDCPAPVTPVSAQSTEPLPREPTVCALHTTLTEYYCDRCECLCCNFCLVLVHWHQEY